MKISGKERREQRGRVAETWSDDTNKYYMACIPFQHMGAFKLAKNPTHTHIPYTPKRNFLRKTFMGILAAFSMHPKHIHLTFHGYVYIYTYSCRFVVCSPSCRRYLFYLLPYHQNHFSFFWRPFGILDVVVYFVVVVLCFTLIVACSR